MYATDSWGLRKGCRWQLVSSRYLSFEWVAIRHPGSGSAHCHGSRHTIAPSCCRRADCSCNYDLCDELSVLVIFCRKNHGRIFHRPTEESSALDLGTLFFSFFPSAEPKNTTKSETPVFGRKLNRCGKKSATRFPNIIMPILNLPRKFGKDLDL